MSASDGEARVSGRLRFVRAGCVLNAAKVSATFYAGFRIVGTGSWSARGVRSGRSYPFSIRSKVEGTPRRAGLIAATSDCA